MIINCEIGIKIEEVMNITWKYQYLAPILEANTLLAAVMRLQLPDYNIVPIPAVAIPNFRYDSDDF